MFNRVKNWLALKWSNFWRKPIPDIELPGTGHKLTEWKSVAMIGDEIFIGVTDYYPWYRRLWDLFWVNRRIGLISNFFPSLFHTFLWGPNPQTRAIITSVDMDFIDMGIDEQGPYFDIKLDENGTPQNLRKLIVYDFYYKRDQDDNCFDELATADENKKVILSRKVGNFLMNEEFISKSPHMDSLKLNCPAYIIGNGPSLEKNAQELANVDNGVVIAMNGSLAKVPKADYFASGDWLGKDFWFDGVDCSKITGIFNCTVPPFVAQRDWKRSIDTCKNYLAKNGSVEAVCGACQFYKGTDIGRCSHDSQKSWKDVYFHSINSTEGHVQFIRKTLRENHGLEVALYDQAVTSTFTALHWAYRAGCNPIVFVGVDGMLTENCKMHVEDDHPDSAARVEAYAKEQMTYARSIDAEAVFLNRHGVDIYNCTEGGILGLNPTFYNRQRIKQRSLKEMVEKLNHGALSWYERYVRT